MNIEYGGLPKETILRIMYPDYAEHMRRTKAHNGEQSKSQKNQQDAIGRKLMRKQNKAIYQHSNIDFGLRLSLTDGTIEKDSTLKALTKEDMRQLLPKVTFDRINRNGNASFRRDDLDGSGR